VIAIDNFISDNGMYRVLAVPDKGEHPWPNGIRVGAGVNSMMLLKDVALGYELWRQINGFPPEYYSELNANLGKEKSSKNKDKNGK
jgi:adhesin transport system membrane fusion protein